MQGTIHASPSPSSISKRGSHVPTRESFGGSFVSPDVADVFHFMFGAQDHDAHVCARIQFQAQDENRRRCEAFARMPLHEIFPQLRKREERA